MSHLSLLTSYLFNLLHACYRDVSSHVGLAAILHGLWISRGSSPVAELTGVSVAIAFLCYVGAGQTPPLHVVSEIIRKVHFGFSWIFVTLYRAKIWWYFGSKCYRVLSFGSKHLLLP